MPERKDASAAAWARADPVHPAEDRDSAFDWPDAAMRSDIHCCTSVRRFCAFVRGGDSPCGGRERDGRTLIRR